MEVGNTRWKGLDPRRRAAPASLVQAKAILRFGTRTLT